MTAAPLASLDCWTARADKKPVLFWAGSPLTIVNNRDSSSEKRVCETVLVGPTGGVVYPRSNGRRSSMAPKLFLEKLLQEIPALAPVVPTYTRLFLIEAATVLGNSPGILTGSPITESLVRLEREMASMLSVLEPALTVKIC